MPTISFSLSRNPEALPDELLDDYEPVGTELIGEGAFAVVRKLRRRSDGRLAALKCVEKHPLVIRNMFAQLKREMRVQGALNHENILRLHASVDGGEHVFMVTEFCELGNLLDCVRDAPGGRLAEGQVACFMRQLARGLDYIHSNGCVHRDLKLENVLLTRAGGSTQLKICDFGWSAEVQAEGCLKTTCGTPAYMAPEILEGGPQDQAVDLWALGCMLYEMSFGQRAFFGKHPEEVRWRILHVQFFVPQYAPAGVAQILRLLLRRQPSSRASCRKILEHPWLRAVAPAEPSPADARKSAPRPARPRPKSLQSFEDDTDSSGPGSEPDNLQLPCVRSRCLQRAQTELTNVQMPTLLTRATKSTMLHADKEKDCLARACTTAVLNAQPDLSLWLEGPNAPTMDEHDEAEEMAAAASKGVSPRSAGPLSPSPATRWPSSSAEESSCSSSSNKAVSLSEATPALPDVFIEPFDMDDSCRRHMEAHAVVDECMQKGALAAIRSSRAAADGGELVARRAPQSSTLSLHVSPSVLRRSSRAVQSPRAFASSPRASQNSQSAPQQSPRLHIREGVSVRRTVPARRTVTAGLAAASPATVSGVRQASMAAFPCRPQSPVRVRLARMDSAPAAHWMDSASAAHGSARGMPALPAAWQAKILTTQAAEAPLAVERSPRAVHVPYRRATAPGPTVAAPAQPVPQQHTVRLSAARPCVPPVHALRWCVVGSAGFRA